jgi:hypothetical protein
MTSSQDYFRGTLAGALALGAGFLVWTVLSFVGGSMENGAFAVREAWDTAAYFWFGLPVLLLSAGIAGTIAPVRVWRWPLLAAAGHIAGMALVHPGGTDLGLVPVAIVLIGLPLTLILTVAAVAGAMVARRGWDGSILA